MPEEVTVLFSSSGNVIGVVPETPEDYALEKGLDVDWAQDRVSGVFWEDNREAGLFTVTRML